MFVCVYVSWIEINTFLWYANVDAFEPGIKFSSAPFEIAAYPVNYSLVSVCKAMTSKLHENERHDKR